MGKHEYENEQVDELNEELEELKDELKALEERKLEALENEQG